MYEDRVQDIARKRYDDMNRVKVDENGKRYLDTTDAMKMMESMRQNDFNRSVTESSLTGRYVKPEVQQLAQQILQSKQDWNDPNKRQQAHTNANQYRSSLKNYGVDADSLFGSNVNMNQAMQNLGKLGTPTYQSQQDKIAQTAQYLGQYQGQDTIGKIDNDRSYQNQVAQIAISRMNAGTSAASQRNSAGNSRFNQLMDIWKATGQAPDGIQGVTPGTSYFDMVGSRPKGGGSSGGSKDGSGGEVVDSTTYYNEFLSDINRIPDYNTGIEVIKAYESDGVDPKIITKMIQDLNKLAKDQGW
jgi:hypothetical protein